MNILLINDYLEGGGAEAVFREQADILQTEHSVSLFYGVESIATRSMRPLSYIHSCYFKKKLSTFLNEHHFDTIIVHNYNGILSPSILDSLQAYKRKTGCKIVHYAHDYHLLCPNRGYCYFRQGRTINYETSPTISEFLFRRLDSRGMVHSLLKKMQWLWAYSMGKKYRVFDLILAPSVFLCNQIKDRYPELRVEHLYNPCNALQTTPFPKRRENDGLLKLVYFGRLTQEKGLVDFINALKQSNVNYSFTLIGEGEHKLAIERAIQQNGLSDKVFVKSKMDHSELFIALQEYDVFVLPSLWYENAPLSIVEAASLGLDLFLADHGGVREIGSICHATHFFNPFDSTDIVRKLDLLYESFFAYQMPKPDIECLKQLFSQENYKQQLNYLIKR